MLGTRKRLTILATSYMLGGNRKINNDNDVNDENDKNIENKKENNIICCKSGSK